MNDWEEWRNNAIHNHLTRKGRPNKNEMDIIDLYKNSFKIGDNISFYVYDKYMRTNKKESGTIENMDGSYFFIGGNKYRFDKVKPFRNTSGG